MGEFVQSGIKRNGEWRLMKLEQGVYAKRNHELPSSRCRSKILCLASRSSQSVSANIFHPARIKGAPDHNPFIRNPKLRAKIELIFLPTTQASSLSLPNSTVGFLDYQLHPLHPSLDFPCASEVTRTVTITVHQAVRGMTIWLENHYPWTESFPQEPYLVSLYKDDGIEFPSMARAAQNGGLDPISRAFPAEIGEVVDIVLLNTGADSGGLDAHPWHAHGRHYWDLGAGNGSYDAIENEGKWAGKEPATRDTVSARHAVHECSIMMRCEIYADAMAADDAL